MQIYTLEQEKRNLCPYDDKCYLLADLPDGTPNPNTHAYGHHELATEVRVQIDMPERSGTELVLEQQQPPTIDEPYHTSLQVVKRKLQFKRRHNRVAKTLAKRGRRDSNSEEIGGDVYEQVPDGDENGDLYSAQLRQAERAAAARPGALLGSEMLSSGSEPVIISACPTLRRNECHRQVRNEPVRALRINVSIPVLSYV